MEHLQQVSGSIQRALHVRDEQMAWVDACCLQFTVKNKDGREKETFTFQTNNPVIKKDWIVGKNERLHNHLQRLCSSFDILIVHILNILFDFCPVFPELRLAQLALDSSNSPAWDVPEQEKRPSTKMPLFVKSLPVFSSPYDTEVRPQLTMTSYEDRVSQIISLCHVPCQAESHAKFF